MRLKNLIIKLLNHKKFSFFFLFLALSFASFSAVESGGDGEEFDPGEMIMHHVTDSHEWHLFDIGDTHITIPLPVILYVPGEGLITFMSSRFEHGHASYKGFSYHHGKIVYEEHTEKIEETPQVEDDGSPHETAHAKTFYDISITKNVAALFVVSILMIIVFMTVAKGYEKNKGKAPSGIQSFFEPVIVYVRDEIIKPNVGPKYERYLPYLMTLFFFVWIGNILGLLPGAANLTGNIAVTMVLALFTLALTVFSGNRNYWGHIFNTPGVPWWLKPIMIPIEIIGIFSKPFSLMLRLFVAITAGHIVILSLIGLIFIFQSIAVGFGSTLIVTFITLIEILVATIQAYVFTLFSSMYIGMAIEEHH
jgi:F-type H+-transporting ATPase subunit a